tara:strand:+ start:2129 stop:2770 length:642 start_codon:yes stop_codon:yes gene_type:complete
MSISYNASTNFGAKDGLPVNDPNKVIYGAEFTTEFNAITAAFGTAAPVASPSFTGTATFQDVSITGSVSIDGESLNASLIEGWNDTKATVDAGAAGWDATKATVDTGASSWDEAYGWGDHALAGYGTSSSDTTYTAGSGLSLTGTQFSLNSTAISSGEVTALTKFKLGSRWEVLLGGSSGLDVIFEYQGTPMMKVDILGNITAVGNVTAYGSL